MRTWIFYLIVGALMTGTGGAEGRADGEHNEPASVGSQPIRGRFYYVIQDLTAERIVSRGVAEADGDIHQGLLLVARHRYREGFLHARTLKFGFSEFVTPGAGESFRFPNTTFRDPHPAETDTDADGIPDIAEYIVGTDPTKPDTDGDGLRDGAEVQQGTNPLDQTPGAVGRLAQANVQGEALDVDALNERVAVAAGTEGVSIFNVGLGLTPTLAARVDTPGFAGRVALAPGFVVVADGSEGLAIVDTGNLNTFSVSRQVPLGEGRETVLSVATAGQFALAGTAEGSVYVVQLDNGAVVQRESVGGPVRDLKVAGDLLLAVTHGTGAFAARTLHVYHLDGIVLVRAGSLSLGTYGPEGLTASSRIAAGNGLAYVTAFVGFDIVDISRPEAPRVLAAARDRNFNSFKQIVPNGSGLGVATVGINPGSQTAHDLWLYDLKDPAANESFLSLIPMPGRARATALFNGLAYVAASQAGLQVVGYQPLDTAGQAPTIALSGSFPINGTTGQAEEGKLARLTATVTDDQQVRRVEFFVNGELIATDGQFPFEARFLTSERSASRTNFIVKATAWDTGGNRASTPDITVELVPDATPPRVVLRQPAPESFVFGDLQEVSLIFNEPVDASAISAGQFHLKGAGTDGILGTVDDSLVAGTVLEYQPDANRLALRLLSPPSSDLYEAHLGLPIQDLAGNPIGSEVSWIFTLVRPGAGVDTDGDGIADVVERLLGLNPADPGDSQRDLDGDGLGTGAELEVGLNPRKADTNGDGIQDGDEDSDRDGLSNRAELARGTDPRRADTDDDGWADEAEVTAGSDPLRNDSRPFIGAYGQPLVELIAPRVARDGSLALGLTVAMPAVEVIAPRAQFGGGLTLGTILARPMVELLAPRVSFVAGQSVFVRVANPPVELIAPRAIFGAGHSLGMTLAQPSVELVLPQSPLSETPSQGTILAQPPVNLEFEPN
jgi:hypothetical protein